MSGHFTAGRPSPATLADASDNLSEGNGGRAPAWQVTNSARIATMFPMQHTVVEPLTGVASCWLWIAPTVRELWPAELQAAYDGWAQLVTKDDYHQKQGR